MYLLLANRPYICGLCLSGRPLVIAFRLAAFWVDSVHLSAPPSLVAKGLNLIRYESLKSLATSLSQNEELSKMLILGICYCALNPAHTELIKR